MLNTIMRAIRTWSSEYCVQCQPFQVCAILGPYAAFLQATFAAQSASRGDLERDLIRETVARIAQYWDIASATLGMFTVVQRLAPSVALLTKNRCHGRCAIAI
jgi:hypothetical protein